MSLPLTAASAVAVQVGDGEHEVEPPETGLHRHAGELTFEELCA